MCRFGLLGVFILNNGTQFSNTTIIELCHDLGVQTKFISIINRQVNGKDE